MHKTTLVVSLLLLLLVFEAGCESTPGQPTLKAPDYGLITPQQKLRADEPSADPSAADSEDRQGPMLQIDAKFLTSSARLIAEHLDMESGMSRAIVSDEQVSIAIDACRELQQTKLLIVPTLTLFSNQPGFIKIGIVQEFVSDTVYDPNSESDDGPAPFTPVIDRFAAETTLSFNAEIKDDSIIINNLQARETELLAWRLCNAAIPRKGKLGSVFWKEAIYMERQGAVTQVDPARIEPGQWLVIPMAGQVRQTTGNARAYAIGGDVQESLTSSAPIGGASAVAEEQLVLLITARPIAAEEVPSTTELSKSE